MLKILSIGRDTLSRLAKFADDALPMESCALLLGKEEYTTDTVHDFVLLKNNDQSKYSFSVNSRSFPRVSKGKQVRIKCYRHISFSSISYPGPQKRQKIYGTKSNCLVDIFDIKP